MYVFFEVVKWKGKCLIFIGSIPLLYGLVEREIQAVSILIFHDLYNRYTARRK